MISYDSKANEYLMTRKDIDDELPKGWEWINEWQIDINGCVASDGMVHFILYLLSCGYLMICVKSNYY